jgi:hypothetical protein
MKSTDLLKLAWSKIDRPHSMCPDIEIGYVRRVLGEVMAAEIKDREIIAEESYRWVFGQLLVSPMSQSSLEGDWYETNRVYRELIQPPNDNYEDEGYQKALSDQFEAEDREKEQRAEEVSEALRYLLTRGLVGRDHERYFGDPAAYQMMVKMSSV